MLIVSALSTSSTRAIADREWKNKECSVEELVVLLHRRQYCPTALLALLG
jgi:hypothetical protein